MSDLTFTCTLDHEPKDGDKISYRTPEGYTIDVMYGFLGFVKNISLQKPLNAEDYYNSYSDGRQRTITEHSLSLKIGCEELRYLTQALGETITIKFERLQETKDGPKKVLRFDTYTIYTKDRYYTYTNIKFNNNTIKSADCKTALIGAPPPRAVLPPLPPLPPRAAPPLPSPNIEDKIARIKELLEGTGLVVEIAPGKLDIIQIKNPGSTMVAHIKDNIIYYPFPEIFKGTLNAGQVKLLDSLGLVLRGGRRKPNRRTNRNKKRRRTHRV